MSASFGGAFSHTHKYLFAMNPPVLVLNPIRGRQGGPGFIAKQFSVLRLAFCTPPIYNHN